METNKMIHVMLDLEAADNKSTAALLMIGAVTFSPFAESVDETFEVIFDFRDVVNFGGTISPSTIQWWMKQNATTMSRVFNGNVGLCKGLKYFCEWYKRVNAERIWANGTTYDIAILEQSMQAVNIGRPYKFRDVRDMRWFKDVVPESVFEDLYKKQKLTSHDALVDATTQALVVQRCYKDLGITEELQWKPKNSE